MIIQEKLSISFEAYVYVVPIRACPLVDSNVPFNLNLLDYLCNLCDVNGCDPFDIAKDSVVHLQWVSKDIMGLSIRNEKVQIHPQLIVDFSFLNYMPLKVLMAKHAKEGSTADIIIPTGTAIFNGKQVPVDLTIQTLFRQASNIYGPVGGYTRFEQALDYVTGNTIHAWRKDHAGIEDEDGKFEKFINDIMKMDIKKPMCDETMSASDLHRSADPFRHPCDKHNIAVITAMHGGSPKSVSHLPFSEEFIRRLLQEPCEMEGMFLINLGDLGGDLDG